MRVLLIAPDHPDLPSVDAEVAAIARFHEVERVVGSVRDTDILRAVEKGEYDILWFATHGGPDGMLLSGSVLSPEGVGQFVATSGAHLCVLNTCASEDVANRIIAGGDADMVFTITDKVGDVDALRFGALFAGELAKTDDFEEAFRIAAGPSTTKYRYLNAKQALRGLTTAVTTEMQEMSRTVRQQGEAIYKITVDAQAAKEASAENRQNITGLILKIDAMSQQTAVAAAQAAATLAVQTAQAAATLAAQAAVARPPTNPPPTTTWIIIGLLVFACCIGLFFVFRTF